MTRAQIYVPCLTCKLRGRCRLSSGIHRDAVLSWAKGLPSVDCDHYQPRFYRGVDGVFALPTSPHPWRAHSQIINYHKDSQ